MPAKPAREVSLVVEVDDALQTFTGTLCSNKRVRVTPGERWARAYVRFLPSTPEGCTRYVVDVGRAARRESSVNRATRVGPDLVTSPNLWLLRDLDAAAPNGTVRFVLPEGLFVNAPFPRVADAGDEVYRLNRAAYRWRSRVVFGPSPKVPVDVSGGRLWVTVVDEEAARAPRAELHAWMRSAAETVASAHGAFPRRETQVVLYPVHEWRDVGFGQVLRGGAPGLHINFGRRVRLADVEDNWVTIHEMSHLFVPRLTQAGIFLSEGVASYYQHMLRARSGMFTEEQAWSKLVAGFARGARDETGNALEEDSDDLWDEYAFQRVYWGGAAVVFLADVELRRRTENRRSLDTALAHLGACCLDRVTLIRPGAMMDVLDEGTGHKVFRETYDAHGPSRDFPETADALAWLGVREDGTLDDTAPGAKTRRAIAGSD